MTEEPIGDARMTSAARREAVRLLLIDFEYQDWEEREQWEIRAEDRSIRALRRALGTLKREKPAWFKLAKWVVARDEAGRVREDLQREVDGMLTWLAQHMPPDIAVPFESIEHWRRDVLRSSEEGPPSVISELCAAYAREAHAAHADVAPADAVGLEPSYTDGLVARPLPTDGEHHHARRLQSIGLAEGSFVADEPPATNGIEVQAVRQPYVPIGRPHRGTRDPVQAAAAILEASQLPTIDAFQAVLGSGRKSRAQRATYEELARIVFDLRSRKRATPEALGGALGCNRTTVWRLVKHGEALMRASSEGSAKQRLPKLQQKST